MYKLGKLPARKDAVTFKFTQYTNLPAVPNKGGHMQLVSGDNNMFGNDELGDCVCAEAGHGTLYYNHEAGNTVNLTTDNIVALYSAITGYKPGDSSTDQGTDMQAAASYRRKNGLNDANGKTHKILAYLDLGVSNRDNLKKAIYYFGGAGIGFNFPEYAMEQFQQGQTWHVQAKDSELDGGHDVFAFGYDTQYVYVISWGKVVKMTWGFFDKFNDETLVYLTQENIKNGKTLEGLNLIQLEADLKQL